MKALLKILSMEPNIAIIDSGVNHRHIHVNGVQGGLSFDLNAAGRVVKEIDFSDTIGHGTAIAGIIKGKVPAARLFALKIFHAELNAPALLLLAALEFAIDQEMKIICLSLGIEKEKYRAALKKLCQNAYNKKIVILAAARSPNDLVLPSAFDTVIGVYWNTECQGNDLLYHPGKPAEFGAHGRPRAIPGLAQERNFRGNSFAVAHVAARVAQLLKSNPDAEPLQIKKMLAHQSV